MEFEHPITKTPEYEALFKAAKLAYPNQYEYLIMLACIDHLSEENQKSEIISSIPNLELLTSNIKSDV